MKTHLIKSYPSIFNLSKKKQLAWKIAEVAANKVSLNNNCIEMVVNRIIDNAAVAIASLNRKPVISARQMAISHPRKKRCNNFWNKLE